jgi:hypothetical protein
MISSKYNHETQKYEPAYPYMAVDETEHYCRLMGDPAHFTVVEVHGESGDSGK